MSTTQKNQLLCDVPLKDYTTWRVGGNASRLYKPSSIIDLADFFVKLPPTEPLLWLGLGSNSLIRDSGFVGTVILTQGGLNEIKLLEDSQIRVEAGVSCATMARFCARNNLASGEFWAGIPGTMGGALFMNAGCFNGETWNFVTEVETINRAGKVFKRTPQEFKISYRSVKGLAEDEWFVAATFKLIAGDKNNSLEVIKTLLAHRAQTQPTSEYNCGSVFKNPQNDYAARLIETSGLKGYQLGGARVSLKHANFIINQNGAATAHDIESLIYFVKDKVQQKTNVELTCEVKIIGENG